MLPIRWVAMRTAVITSAFTTTLGWYMVYINTDANASNVGFSLVQGALRWQHVCGSLLSYTQSLLGMGFSSMILAWIRQFNILQSKFAVFYGIALPYFLTFLC